MAGIYKIGSKLGYDLATGMKAGDSITATDGSIWTMGNDGKIQVNHNGNMMQGVITYQPTNQQAVAAMKGGAGYSSPYKATLQQAIAGIGSSQWGGWDKDTDESYKAYRKEYLREADRTMQDVLGQYAQNTGGIAGSSAIAAASQAADYQKAQLADKIPQLYDAAYGRYMQDVQRQQQYAGLLMDAEQMAQNAYYKQIDYALSKWAQMGYADQEVAGILGVTAGTPTGDQAYTDWSTAFEREQFDAAQQAAAQKAQQQVKDSGNPRKTDPRTPQEADGVSMPTAEFNQLLRGLKEAAMANQEARLDSLLEDNVDRLSEEQYQTIADQLKKLKQGGFGG